MKLTIVKTLYHNEKIHQISIYDNFCILLILVENAITILEKNSNKF